MKNYMAILVVLSFLLAGVALGAEDRRWGDEAEFSFVETGGNTEVNTLSFKNTLKYSFSQKMLGTWKLETLNSKSDGVRNAERYSTEFRLDYSYTERIFSYGNAGWLKDRFSGIDARYYVGAGGGYKFLLGPKHYLDGEAGLTYTTEDYTNGRDDNYIGGRLFGLYEYAFSEKNRFSQSLEWLLNFDDSSDWDLNSETAVISALNGFLSLKASYVVYYDNRPVAGFERTDTKLGVALVANF